MTISHLRVGPLLFITAFLAVPMVAAECPADYLDKRALVKLAHASSLRELCSAFLAIPIPDAVSKLVYAVRQAELQPGPEADDALIAVIPRYELEYEFVYSVTTSELDRDEALNSICGGGWLDRVADAIVRRGHGFAAFLRLSFFNNADLAEQLPELNSFLREKQPAAFAKALASLPREVRDSVAFE